MYVERVKAKHKYYLYLKKYDSSVTYSSDKRVTLFGLGREERALSEMKLWAININLLPIELKELGCTRDDVKKWIRSVEERRDKRLSA